MYRRTDLRNDLATLQTWYARRCDHDWHERAEGIRIESIDNPGWHVVIDLRGTPLEHAPLEPVELDEWKHCWMTIRRNGTDFEAAGDPTRLGEIVRVFLDWAAEHEAQGDDAGREPQASPSVQPEQAA